MGTRKSADVCHGCLTYGCFPRLGKSLGKRSSEITKKCEASTLSRNPSQAMHNARSAAYTHRNLFFNIIRNGKQHCQRMQIGERQSLAQFPANKEIRGCSKSDIWIIWMGTGTHVGAKKVKWPREYCIFHERSIFCDITRLVMMSWVWPHSSSCVWIYNFFSFAAKIDLFLNSPVSNTMLDSEDTGHVPSKACSGAAAAVLIFIIYCVLCTEIWS